MNGITAEVALELAKLDSGATDGLAGTSNSLAYRVHEIERHLHSYEHWFETATVPDAELHRADRIGDGAGAFQADAGNDDWGAWVQLLGSEDTPVAVGSAHFDLHVVMVEAAERAETYFIQIAAGASGAAALAAGDYTEFVYRPILLNIQSSPVVIQMRRQDTTTKVWARCMCPGQNTATLDFYFGLHEYPGV